MSNGDGQTLYAKDDTGAYQEYTAPTFRELLPEDVREHEHLKSFETPGALAKSYVDLKSSIVVPPESAEAYDFTVPEEMKMDTDAIKEFKQLAFDMSLTSEDAAKLVEFDVARLKKAHESLQAGAAKTRQEAETKLKQDWGDEYEANLDVAKRAIEKFGGQILRDFLNETKLGDRPELVQFCHAVGKAMGESILAPETAVRKGPELDAYGKPMLRFPSMDK